MYIDTHTHLFAHQFENDLADAVKRAQQAGVERFILPDIERESFDGMMKLAEEYSGICLPTIGLHPTSVGANYEDELNFVRQNIDRHKFVAMGEIGIDCYWSVEFIEQQRYVFEQQIRMASERNMPIIIHARESFNEIFAVLDKLMPAVNISGVFHSFAGSQADYDKIKSYGTFKVGIGGIVTFKNGGIADIVKNMDLSDIVLETDSPYLAPVPYRGKRNESAYIPLIAQKIADLKQINISEVERQTTVNAKKLFNIE